MAGEKDFADEVMGKLGTKQQNIVKAGNAFDPNAVKQGLAAVIDTEFKPAPVEFESNGFVSLMAAEVFRLNGNKDAATRCDAMVNLFGDKLYEQIKAASLCAGLDNEADWLAQQIHVSVERETFDPKGGRDKRTAEDDQPDSEYNQKIERMFGRRALGRIASVAKDRGISNPECLRYGVLNHLNFLRSSGTM